MIRVKNRKAITRLSGKSLKANRVRNVIAVSAVILTTMLFTALFTIVGAVLESFEQSNFRQAGGDFHGTFKYLTREQLEELSKDPLIVKYGETIVLGMPTDPPFNKAHVEVRYLDEIGAKGSFCVPTEGSLPEENTDQIAADTRILTLLGVEPKVGEKITLTYYMGMTENAIPVTETFTLSGWWEYDSANMASQALVPRSYAEEKAAWYEPQKDPADEQSCSWGLDVYFKNSRNIEENMKTVLENHGYQTEDKSKDNYIAIGVNWGYVGAQASQKMDPGTMAAMIVLLMLIILTGYLIINNIFRISVTNDIRFYGLLKTIGTTGKQIKNMIRRQALILCLIGIPLGVLCGYLIGNVLAPVVMRSLTYTNTATSTHPLIFVGAILFSLITVLVSCAKPGRMAAKVSPVEAVRYTEGSHTKKKIRHGESGGKLGRMALANLGRSKSRTVLVIVSLGLTVMLLEITAIFADGFDMDKYLDKFVVTDYIFGGADYFQVGTGFHAGNVLTEEDIAAVKSQGGITESARIYGAVTSMEEFISEDYFKERYANRNTEKEIQAMLDNAERLETGEVADRVTMYGMEDLALDYLDVIEGDLADVYDPSKKAVAAVYLTDDYGETLWDTNWAKTGEQVTIRYVDEWEYFSSETGEKIEDIENFEGDFEQRALKYHDEIYTVAACVTMKNSMSYRYYGYDEFVLNAQTFMEDTGSSSIMTYIFNTTEESDASMGEFLTDYTEKVNPTLDFESKESYASQFYGFRNMFVMMGGVLSFVVGVVGILNFLNAILTSIVTRRREFAMLQSIGMTGKQLKTMLVYEGMLYASIASGISFVLGLTVGPLLGKVMGTMFWFFTYRFTIIPIIIMTPIFLILGIILPLVSYRYSNKQTIVERLRIE